MILTILEIQLQLRDLGLANKAIQIPRQQNVLATINYQYCQINFISVAKYHYQQTNTNRKLTTILLGSIGNFIRITISSLTATELVDYKIHIIGMNE